MKLQNFKNIISDSIKKIKEIDLNSILEELQNLKIDDLKNINYRRLFYDIRNSKYLKPTIGIFSASLVSIFVFIPAFETVNSSFKKAKKYQYEAKNLPNKISDLKNQSLKFKDIKTKMDKINSSFIRNDQIIFMVQLLNKTAKTTNVKINSFKPILRPESSKLCKVSTFQKKSKKFKSVKKPQFL